MMNADMLAPSVRESRYAYTLAARDRPTTSTLQPTSPAPKSTRSGDDALSGIEPRPVEFYEEPVPTAE
jgi:hypothetical protein